MATLPQPQNPEQMAHIRRAKQLESGGYIECIQNRWMLTDLGWRALSAAADFRRAPSRPTKAMLEAELVVAQLMRIQGAKWLI